MKVKISVILCLLAVQSMMAGLRVVGPVSPANGFPAWIMDQNGNVVQIGLDGDGVTGLSIYSPVDPQNPFSVQIGFGDEAFYWMAGAVVDFANGGRGVLTLALEAAFGGVGTPLNGQQFVFSRIRFVFDPPVGGTYTIVHPYGTNTFTDVPAGESFTWTSDLGDFAPFGGVLNGDIPTLLTAFNPHPPIGYLGNPQILQTVTGSSTGNNFFRITGPNGSDLGGQGVRFVQTNLFSVSGKLYTFAPGETYCEAPIKSDIDGDCKAGMSDFAAIALIWLNCNLIPADACAD